VDITAHIPDYLPSDLSWGTISRVTQTAVFGSPSNTNKLYVYRYFYDGNTKLQSSWSVWEMSPYISIRGGEFFDDRLVLAANIEASGSVQSPKLLNLDLRNPNQTGFSHALYMDYLRAGVTGATGGGPPHDRTAITFSGSFPAAAKVLVVGGADAGDWKNREIPSVIDGGNLYVTESLPSGVQVHIGFEYTREFEPSRLDLVTNVATGLSRGTPEPMTNARVQVRRVKAQLREAGHLVAEVKRNGTVVSEKVYTPVRVGEIVGEVSPSPADEFEIDVGGNAKEVSLVFSNSSFLPCGITSLSWESLYHNRSNPRR
jgi:hypothetical protein